MCPAARSRVARIFSSAAAVWSGNSAMKLSVLARGIGSQTFFWFSMYRFTTARGAPPTVATK
jgi:hypothetical protein